MWAVLLLSTAHISFGQILSPGESLVTIPTAETRTDARLTIGYGQLPNEVASPSGGRFDPAKYRDEVYVISLQFIPRVTLHYRQSFKRADIVQATGDRVIGAQVTAFKESYRFPGLAVGVRDAAGTRKHHATYALASKGFDFGKIRPALTLGYSKHFLDASFLEMKDGVFYGVSVLAWNRAQFMWDYDTRFHYAGVRVWPLKWIWVTGFVAEWENPGFGFGISRVLYGSADSRSN